MVRLQKYMADAGIASRRKCEEIIAAGLVKVNGVIATVGMSVTPGVDTVVYDGKRVTQASERVVIIFYKPRGVISADSDPQGRETVGDYFRDIPERLYNVGRLDYDTEGLLVMTNDGELAHRMTHPSFMVEKTYYVICDGVLTPSERRALSEGVDLSDGRTFPAEVHDVHRLKNGNTGFFISIHEGRNRQVRRMVSAVGHDTVMLMRVSEGPLKLGNLKSGQWRRLDDAELKALDALLAGK